MNNHSVSPHPKHAAAFKKNGPALLPGRRRSDITFRLYFFTSAAAAGAAAGANALLGIAHEKSVRVNVA